MMRYNILLLLMVVAWVVQGGAESNPQAVPGMGVRSPEKSQVPTVPVFDDAIWAPRKLAAEPETSTSPRSNRTRFIDRGYGEYNTQNYKDWQATCASANEDPEKYSECFRKARAESRGELQQGRESVEKKQSKPLRNVSPLRIPSMEGENR